MRRPGVGKSVLSMFVLVAVLALPSGAAARALPDSTAPLPGGTYKTRAHGDLHLRVHVGMKSSNGVARGKLRLRCPGAKAVKTRFRVKDGQFIAKRKIAKRRLKVRVRGTFVTPDRLKAEILKSRHAGRCGRSQVTARLRVPGRVKSKTVEYGPFTVKGTPKSHDHMGDMGDGNTDVHVMGSMRSVSQFDVQRPCSDCYVVAMVPDLVYQDGSIANFDTGAMLHHVVMFNATGTDATCGAKPFGRLGERFFASGNERTVFALPKGYGYHVTPDANWRVLADLMNMKTQSQTYGVRITYYYVKAPAAVQPVTPVWLDIDNCGNSQYPIPAGWSDTKWDFQVPPSMAGQIVSVAGHQHNSGVKINLSNNGELVCSSRDGHDSNPAYMGNIESMTGCTGRSVARIQAGDTLQLDSIYNSPVAQNDVMGIMIAYVATDPEP